MQKKTENSRLAAGLRVALPLMLLLLCEWFFFSKMYGTDRLFGNMGDGRLTMLIAEHWRHVLRGEAAFADLGIFWPAQNTLAYSDMLLGLGLLHALLRALGMSIYLAFKYAILLMHAVGTFSCYYLLKRVLRLGGGWALMGALAFSFSDSYVGCLEHPQMAALGFIPLFVIFLVRFFQQLEHRGRRAAYAALAILTIMLVLYTAWYVAFFTALFAVTFLVIGLCVMGLNGVGIRKTLGGFLRTVRFDLLAYAAFAAALAVPFALLEWPVMQASGGYNFLPIFNAYVPEIIDVIHVDDNNYMLGGWMQSLFQIPRSSIAEVNYGFSLVLLLSFFIMFFFIQRRKHRVRRDTRRMVLYLLCETVAIAVLIDILLMVRLGSNGVSLWYFVNRYFPGGKSIRAVGRLMLFLNLPMAVITACMGALLLQKEQKRVSFAISAGLAVLVVLFNLNARGTKSNWTAAAGAETVNRVAPPPADCEVFFLYNSNNDGSATFRQMDAYQIADALGIKTINGYSGQMPRAWNGIWEIDGMGYLPSVVRWVEENDLQHVYGYNQAENTWTEINDLPLDPCLDIGAKKIPWNAEGLWDLKPTAEYSWTKAKVEVTLKDAAITRDGLRVWAEAPWEHFRRQMPDIEPECRVMVNGQQIAVFNEETQIGDQILPVPPDESDTYTICIECNAYYCPAALGDSADTRELCMKLFYLGAP